MIKECVYFSGHTLNCYMVLQVWNVDLSQSKWAYLLKIIFPPQHNAVSAMVTTWPGLDMRQCDAWHWQWCDQVVAVWHGVTWQFLCHYSSQNWSQIKIQHLSCHAPSSQMKKSNCWLCCTRLRLRFSDLILNRAEQRADRWEPLTWV